MNRRLFPLALSLALLAGCAPAPEPTPEPTPTPAAAVDFHAPANAGMPVGRKASCTRFIQRTPFTDSVVSFR